MAMRVTIDDVKGILGNHYDENRNLSPFIDTASGIVDYIDECDTDGDLSTTALARIEKWLAAHFYGHSDQFLSEKETGRAKGKFQGQTAMHLDSTQYGQTALLLDTTGCLNRLNESAKIGGKKKVGVHWLGKETQLNLIDEGRV